MTATNDYQFCPYCGSKLTPNAKECANCHKPLAVTKPTNPDPNRALFKLMMNPYKEGMERDRIASGKPVKKSIPFWKKWLNKKDTN